MKKPYKKFPDAFMPEQFRAVSYIDGLFALSRNYLINYVNMETVRYSLHNEQSIIEANAAYPCARLQTVSWTYGVS